MTNAYRVRGIVKAISGNSALLHRNLGTYYEYDPQTEVATTAFGTSGLLTTLAAGQLGRSGRITAGQYFALDWKAQMHFRKVMQTEVVVLTNCPPELAINDTEIDVFAMPSGLGLYGGQWIGRFDIGVKATTVPSNAPAFYFKITTNGPVRVPIKKPTI